MSTSGWCTEVWITKRFSPIASSLSAVGLSVAGDQAHGPDAAVIDSAATRFWPYRCATDADSRMSAFAPYCSALTPGCCVHMAPIGTSALRLASMPSPMNARPASCDSP